SHPTARNRSRARRRRADTRYRTARSVDRGPVASPAFALPRSSSCARYTRSDRRCRHARMSRSAPQLAHGRRRFFSPPRKPMTKSPLLPCLALLVPLGALAQDPEIPYDEFSLDNGLRVIVHEDHKAPIIAVTIWYHVGSKNEVAGKTGFAHLFE